MKLLPNEEKLIISNADKIILTNHRIQMNDSVWGQSYTISIFLEDISSIEIKYKSNLIFIIFGVLSILAGVFLAGEHNGGQEIILGLVGGGVFLAFWWFSRKHIISISSDGGSVMKFIVSSMSDDKIADFIYNVSLAKQTRLNQLYRI
jgi:hypothetical protein